MMNRIRKNGRRDIHGDDNYYDDKVEDAINVEFMPQGTTINVNEYGDRPPYLLNSIRRRHLDVCHEV
jgi:hypothetical protein